MSRAAYVGVETHLRAIEGRNIVKAEDVVIKETKPLRLAEMRGVAAGLAPEQIGPVFLTLTPSWIDNLQRRAPDPALWCTTTTSRRKTGGSGACRL